MSFENFVADMFPSFINGLKLDRRRNNGNYTKSNCRWATQYVQNNNRSNNRLIKVNGKTLTFAQAERELCLGKNVIHGRLRIGWSHKKAISVLPRNRK